MCKYILGVDGGGTKTHCALFHADGRLIEFVEWTTTSHEFLRGGYVELRRELHKLLGRIQQKNEIDWAQTEAVFGMAGVDCKTQEEKIGAFIRECGLNRFLLCNDSFLGIKAGSPQPWGICTLNGSGTGACGIDPQGKRCNRGALFELTGDYAGGRMLGAEVVRSVYDMLFRDGKATCLKELLFEQLGVCTRENMMEMIISGVADHTLEPKSFAPLLFEAACRKDETALDILESCGRQNARDICAVIEALHFPVGETIPIIMLGSLYTKAKHDHIIEVLDASLCGADIGRTFELINLKSPPVLGAVVWAMERVGIECDRTDVATQIDVCCARGSAT